MEADEIIHGKLNLTVLPPPAYKRKVWDYHKVDSEELKNKLNSIGWRELFQDMNVNMMTETFTKTVLEIINSTIPNKIITCNEKDPLWMTPEVKTAIKRKHRVYKKYVARGRRDDELDYMKMIRNETTHLIDRAKESYFEKLGKKLCDPSIGMKSYWTTIKQIKTKARPQ